MTKLVLCDVPNTLFDSRHRCNELGFYLTGIEQDELNYPCFQLIKNFEKLNYTLVFTHYALDRKKSFVQDLLKRHNISTKNLVIDFATQDVYDNQTLKKYIFERSLQDFSFIIDNDSKMTTYWLQQEVALLQVPLGIRYEVE